MVGYSDTEKALLRRMFYDRIIGGRHHGERELCRGFPKGFAGDVPSALKKFVKDGLVMQHPTIYGKQYSLNPRAIKEIKEIIGDEI